MDPVKRKKWVLVRWSVQCRFHLQWVDCTKICRILYSWQEQVVLNIANTFWSLRASSALGWGQFKLQSSVGCWGATLGSILFPFLPHITWLKLAWCIGHIPFWDKNINTKYKESQRRKQCHEISIWAPYEQAKKVLWTFLFSWRFFIAKFENRVST